MRRTLTLIMLATMLTYFGFFFKPVEAHTRQIYLVATTSPSTSSLSNIASSQSINKDDNTAINVALIGLVGAILGALAVIVAGFITGWLPFHLERKKAIKEQELIRKERDVESARTAMIYAKTIKERIDAYRDAIWADPRISTLQILDMNQPLDITSTYVQLRIHREITPRYKLNQDLLMAEEQHDPNALLKLDQHRVAVLFESSLDPIEAIQKYKRCVIVGDPGAGKTTLLKYLTLKSVAGQLNRLPDLPIHIELNAFAVSNNNDLLEFVSSVWENRYNFPANEALSYMQNNLQRGRTILLLDGLDETVVGKTKEESEESYTRVVDAITNIAVKYHQSPIVVTVRKAGYFQRKRLQGFTDLEVLDFRPQDIEHFVNNWFARYPTSDKQANAKDLNNLLQRNPRLHVLASNPLLLSLIAIVYEAELDLPDRRSELYKQCADIMLAKWDASRNIHRRREFKPLHKRQLLQEVAWHFHIQGRRYFPEDELLEIIARFLPAVGLSPNQSRDILDEIANENGLLKEQARNWHGFLHLTLQEYFVAQYAVDNNKLDTILEHRHDSWWREVVLLYAGLISDASPLLEALLEKGRNKPSFPVNYRNNDEAILAGYCLATHPTVRKTALRKEIVSQLLPIVSTTNSADVMRDIGQTLVEIGGKDVYTSILKLISSNQIDRLNRQQLLYALRDRGERIVVPDLLKLLLDTQIDLNTRETTAYIIGVMGDHSVMPELLRLLCNPQTDFSLCRSIYFALNQLNAFSLRSALNQLLYDRKTDPSVRTHLSKVLASLDGKYRW